MRNGIGAPFGWYDRIREAPRRRLPSPGAIGAALIAALLVLSCRSAGSYVWVDALPAAEKVDGDGQYRIEAGDVISVRVWQQDAMSTDRARVREDGRITLPLVQDVEVAGLSPSELATRLQARLKSYVVNPLVTVAVVEVRPLRVPVIGEVARQGTYELERGSGVLQALAAAGGFTEYARRDMIFVLRREPGASGAPAPTRIRFRYEALARGEKEATSFRLRASDAVVVE